jgi:uncharacterized membrane-anchored protein YhcB (DUF1043 family)
MAGGLVVVVVSVVVSFVVGLLVGYRLSERKRLAQVRRQAAAQTSVYRQLHELQVARHRDVVGHRGVTVSG